MALTSLGGTPIRSGTGSSLPKALDLSVVNPKGSPEAKSTNMSSDIATTETASQLKFNRHLYFCDVGEFFIFFTVIDLTVT